MHRDPWRWSSPLSPFVLAIAIALGGCVSESVTSTTVTTTLETTTTTEGKDIPVWDGTTSGEVRTESFQPGFTLVVPDGWARDCPDSPILVDMVPAGMTPLASTMGVWAQDFDSVEETVAHLMEAPADHTDPEPASVGGAEGLTFDSVPGSDYTIFEAPNSCIFSMAAGETWRFWVVDVDGAIVTFALFAPSDQLEDIANQAREILDSVVWD